MLYVAGAIVAFWRTDAGWAGRTALALLWPLGPLAFIVTITMLLAVSLIAFPAVGAAAAAAALAVWWLMR